MSPSDGSHPAPMPSSQRCEPGSVNPPLAKWPNSVTEGRVDAAAVTNDVIGKLHTHLGTAPSKKAAEGVASLFAEDSYWRDHLALSWDLRTLKTRSGIAAFLEDNASLTGIEVDSSTAFRAPKVTDFGPEGKCRGILSYLTVTTQLGRGRGLVRLVQDAGAWKIWVLYTALEELAGFEELRGPRRPNGVQHGFHHGRKNWRDRRQDEESFRGADPDVLIIGMPLAPPLEPCTS